MWHKGPSQADFIEASQHVHSHIKHITHFTSGVAPWHTLFPRPLQYRPRLGGKCRKLTPWNCESVGHVPVHQAKTSTACVISVIADPRTSDLSTINVWFPVAIIFFLDSSSQLQTALWKNIFYATGQHFMSAVSPCAYGSRSAPQIWLFNITGLFIFGQEEKQDCHATSNFVNSRKHQRKT